MTDEAKILCEIHELLEKQAVSPYSGLTIVATPFRVDFENGRAKIPGNAYRQGFIAVNMTDAVVYGVADENDANLSYFTWRIESNGTEYYIPANGAYPGTVTFNTGGTGYLMVTEFSFQERL